MELAAVAYYLQSWRHYLERCPGGVTMVTDHQPLACLMNLPGFRQDGYDWARFNRFVPPLNINLGKLI